MSEVDDGGPAFPMPQQLYSKRAWNNDDTQIIAGQRGLSLRDWFIAHAPAEPQAWFAPTVPPKPELPDRFKELSEEDRRELERLDEFPVSVIAEEEGNEAVRAFCQRKSEAFDAQQAWEAELKKQRYIQWPVAWAEAVLKARKL